MTEGQPNLLNPVLDSLHFKNLVRLQVPHCITTRQWQSINPFVGYKSLHRLGQGLNVHPNLLATRIIFAEEVHGPNTHWCVETDGGSVRLQVDGLISREPALLAIYAADCVPVLVYDPLQNAVAALHVGRRGAIAGIIEAGIGAMVGRYGSKPETLVVGMGPCLRSCCYEVQEDIFPELEAAGWMKFLEEREGNYYLDLPEACKMILKSCGVSSNLVEDLEICTSCSSDILFSARRRTTDEERGSSICALISVPDQH